MIHTGYLLQNLDHIFQVLPAVYRQCQGGQAVAFVNGSGIYRLDLHMGLGSIGAGNNYYTPASDALEAAGMPKMKFVTKGSIRNNRWGI